MSQIYLFLNILGYLCNFCTLFGSKVYAFIAAGLGYRTYVFCFLQSLFCIVLNTANRNTRVYHKNQTCTNCNSKFFTMTIIKFCQKCYKLKFEGWMGKKQMSMYNRKWANITNIYTIGRRIIGEYVQQKKGHVTEI